MDNLTAKAKIGAFWVILEQVILKVFSFVTNIVLARLLFPEDFGVVAIALVAWEIIKLFGNFGIAAKLIYQQEKINEYATSAFWLNIVVSLALGLVTIFIAPYVARFYGNELVQPILVLFSLAFVVQSLGTTHLALLRKELAFKKITLVEVVTTLFSRSFAIGMAFMGFGVWSLVIPEVIASPFKAVAFWIINPWKPDFKLNTGYWRDIFKFGFNYLGADLTRYLNINGDYIIIGKMLGERSLGLYTFAYNIANLPFQNITSTVSKVAFPTFSKLQDDLKRFQKVLLKMTKFTSLTAFPLLMELLILADLLIPLVYGDKWKEAIMPLQIIIGFILFRVFSSPGGQVLIALGKPDTLFRFNLIQSPFLLAAVFIGSHYGISGAAAGMSSVLIIGSLILVHISAKPLGLSIWSVLQTILPATISSVLMVFSIRFLKYILMSNGLNSYLTVSILIPSGLGIYLLTLFLFFKDDSRFLWNIIWESLVSRLVPMFKKPTISQSI